MSAARPRRPRKPGPRGEWPDPRDEWEAPLRLVARRWSELIAFDLAMVAVTALVAVKAGSLPAVGSWVAFSAVYVFWLRRRMPHSPGRKAAGVLAGLGFVALVVGAGYGTTRVYLDLWGRTGTATVIDKSSGTTRGGGRAYTCTVVLPDGDERQLQASNSTCERAHPMLEGSRVPVVYDPAHVVRPMAGTKDQLATGKSVLPGGIGLLLVIGAAAHAIGSTAIAERDRRAGPGRDAAPLRDS
ncbi:hypothetical protein ACGFYV_18440 [Streptomyces sp. NPDC048297]|uniref:hypothetical protein n=1 Tax=Streptomyces sp. NPDC048297 TaxID=3365531 RepID=UPI003710A503